MKRWKNCLAASLAGLSLFMQPAKAAFLTDLWWKSDESGWGANVVHQDDVAFVTLFVYSPAGEPTWYVATTTQVALMPGGLPVMSGTLYSARGPWFGAAFDPSLVRLAPVGMLSITPADASNARFDYDVDGVRASKIMSRQSLRAPVSEPAGLGYNATMSLTLRAPDKLPEKSRVTGTAEMQIAHDFATLSVRDAEELCFHGGPIVQAGKFSTVSGTYACTSGRTGTVEISELEFSRNGFVARISMTTPEGILAGTIAGAAR